MRGPPQGLLTPPSADGGVVPGAQHGRNLVVAPHRRSGVHRRLQQPAGEGVVHHGLGVADDSGQQPGDRFQDDQGGDLSPGKNVVTDGDLVVGPLVDDARVDAFVTAAAEHQPLFVGQAGGVRLREGPPDRGRDDDPGPPAVRRSQRADLGQRRPPRLRTHDHARTPAVGGVIDGPVHVVRPLS